MRVPEQLASREIVVFLGPGGVGKTTVSAAAALEASRTRRTLVLTIDPARRLADALGVKLGSDPVEVRPRLDAMMLDTKKALDDLIERYAPNPETMKRIFRSRFYETLSDAFAGSEEFVAMGALYELVHSGRWDVVVVDTPPSRHAVDFLKVNRKLIRVFDSGVVKYVFKPTRVLRMGGGYLAGVLAKWTSAQYLEEVSEFITTFDPMFMDLERRVRAMEAILTDRGRTSLNLVTSPEPAAAAAALELGREVQERLGLALEACVVNRVFPSFAGLGFLRDIAEPGKARDAAAEALGAERVPFADAEAFLEDAIEAGRFYSAVAAEHARQLEHLRGSLGVPVVPVPALGGSIHDLDGLERLRQRLIA